MTDWTAVLRRASPRARSAVLEAIAPWLDREFARGEISTPARQAQFLANAAVETDGFVTFEEYGGPAYFARYDGRRDLGNTSPRDGARFKGRGLFDLTGRANYAHEAARTGVDLVAHPELVATGRFAVATAVDFWVEHGCNALADAGQTTAVRRRINGGTNGLPAVKAYLARITAALAGADAAEAEPPAREKVRAIQVRLRDLNYAMVGTPDGLVGSNTTAALAAYQHDHELTVTGEIDPDTERTLWSDDQSRALPRSRTAGLPEGSRILTGANAILTGASVAGAGGAVAGLDDVLGRLKAVRGVVDGVRPLLAPFAPIAGFVAAHPALLVVAAAIAAGVLAWRIRAARIEDHQLGRTA